MVKTHVMLRTADGKKAKARIVAVSRSTVTVRVGGQEYWFRRSNGLPVFRDCEWYMGTDELQDFAPQNQEAMRGNREVF